jgi:DNA-binding response OmpR family regulator
MSVGAGTADRIVKPLTVRGEIVATSPTNTAAVPDVAAPTPRWPSLPCRILVVEDASGDRRAADVLAAATGVEADIAADGETANQMVGAAKLDRRPFHLILIDMQTPNIDGVDAARDLRKNRWDGPIAAVSDYGSEADRSRFFDAGCDDLIAKPLSGNKLVASIARLVNRYDCLFEASQIIGGAAAGKPAPTVHGRLLVAEDAHCVQKALDMILRKISVECDTADDGRAACDMALRSKEEARPYDLILMDIQMPKMNGRQAAVWLRDNGWKGPIVALSGHASHRDHESFLKAGCDDYLTKPVTEATLRNMLSLYMGDAGTSV